MPLTCIIGLLTAMTQSFFPAGSFSGNANVDAFQRELYSYKLRVAGELPLWNSLLHGDEHYRFFTSEGSFSGIVRVQRVGMTRDLVVKRLRLDRPGGPDEARWSVTEYQRELSPREWTRFETLLFKANVCEMAPWDDPIGLDGFHCVIETRDSRRYHSVDRWSPRRDNFGKLCDYFVSLYDGLVERPHPWWRLQGRRITRR